jgi:putative transposase
MYEYSKFTPVQRAGRVDQRLAQGYPSHAPLHPVRDQPFYLLTVACYEHLSHMRAQDRRVQVLDALFEQFNLNGIEIRAWVVLPNHYHLLANVTSFDALGGLFRRVHGPTSRHWNQEDDRPGRRVWYRFTDRAIRSPRHYATTLNYIHYNPVKHGWAKSPYDWQESSVYWYLEHLGRDGLPDAWVRYPVRDYGRGWDDLEGAK